MRLRLARRVLGLALGFLATPRAALAQAEPSASAAASDAQQVTVHGERPEPASDQLTSSEVKQIPGSFGDAFRAIEALPGVTPLVSGLPYFLVRGAPPGNTGFFIDGVRVPALFHLGVGQAVIHPDLIDRVDFYPGAYPARFGRFTGGILSGELAEIPDHAREEASIRLLDAGGLVETPFADGRGEVEVSGRYGYPGPLLSLFAPNVGLSYWDYQARVRWQLTDRDAVGAFVFGSYDSLTSKDGAGRWDELLGIQFHRVDLRWDHRTSVTGRLRVALTLGYDRSEAGSESSTTTLTNGGLSTTSISTSPNDAIESQLVGLRAEWSDELSPSLDARMGSDVTMEPYRVAVPRGGGIQSLGSASFDDNPANFTQIDVNGGAYGELSWRPSPRVELRPGVRLDAFTSRSVGGAPLLGGDSGSARAVGAFDPRVAARWDMNPWLALIAAVGAAHQPSNIPLPSPGLQFSQLARGVQAAYQYTAGAELRLPLEFTATIDGFLQDYTGIADYYESCPPGETTCTFDGRSVGLEVLVRRRLTERLTGWLSYTLSRTDRDAFYGNRWIRILSAFDRPQVVNAVVAADLGKRWRAGVRVMAYSGLPYSTTTGIVGPPDAREPPFVRVDVRLEKKWRALGGTMTFVVEWLNALLSKESFGTTCSTSQSPACQPEAIGPITFPSVGIEEVW